MTTIHLISHTHWDREWYLTFQQFRLKLIFLIDNLLDLLAADPEFKHFMLDGQTIILDDYLYMRPEREEELRSLIQNGRLLVGPWYVLPDEFLVSPEAIIRNLLQGDRIARRFGVKMKVGYIPDPFGHIGQMPQILAGFGIEFACVQRGLSDEPCEIWWQAPDGTGLLTAYLRDGYANAVLLPTTHPQEFTQEIQKLCGSLSPHCLTPHILLMQGNDHTPAQGGTSACITYANQKLDSDQIIHSNLPLYFSDVQSEIHNQKSITVPTVVGELRSSKRHHLLAGVLSTRAWIKQRNHVCETLMEKWSEPHSVFGHQISVSNPQPTTENSQIHIQANASILRQAWRLLMECQPHDSICGCSIDQVHEEMRNRFDQVEQIGEEITRLSLKSICTSVNTTPPYPDQWQSANKNPRKAILSIIVFNPNDITCSELVEVILPIPDSQQDYEIIDDTGRTIPSQVLEATAHPLATLTQDRSGIFNLLEGAKNGKVTGFSMQGLSIQDVKLEKKPEALHIYVSLSDFGEPNAEMLSRVPLELAPMLADANLDKFIVKAEIVSSKARFLAEKIPPHGYRTFWPHSKPGANHVHASLDAKHPSSSSRHSIPHISNEFFRVEISSEDGTLTLTDLRSGMVLRNINRFVDGGDCGDEYTFCRPPEDQLIESKVRGIQLSVSPLEQSIRVELEMQVPDGLDLERKARSAETLPLTITTTANLVPGVPRLDIHTEVDNRSKDHRLRVHFPAPFGVAYGDFDGHFEIVKRPVGVPSYDENWAETPRPEVPQRAFTSIASKDYGLVVANRGLREVEVLKNEEGLAEIAITLLRCVGWLSRDDFPTRRGHAGPAIPTPGAQMIGRWIFDYSIIPFLKGEKISAYHQAYAFNAPPRAITEILHSGFLPCTESFIQVSPQSFVISSIKEAEDGQGWIIRGCNLAPKPVLATLRLWQPFNHVVRTNLSEELIEELDIDSDRSISILVRGNEVLTLKINR